MPAITVDDITVLPRIPAPDPIHARQRAVRGVTTAPRGFEGEGFPVRRAFAGVDLGAASEDGKAGCPRPDCGDLASGVLALDASADDEGRRVRSSSRR